MLRSIYFVQSLIYKINKIEAIVKRNQLFPILKGYAKQSERQRKQQGYRCLNISELISSEYYDDDKVICWQLAKGNVMMFKKIYETMDFMEVFELYILKLAVEFQEPPPVKERIL